MKKEKVLLSLLTIPFLFGFASCNVGNNEGSDEKSVKLTLPTNVTKYVLDDKDYSKEDIKVTDTIRVLYRRNDNNEEYSNYEGWRIWAWDTAEGGTGWWYEFTKYNEFGVICDIPVSEVAANGASISRIGIVITTCNSKTASWGDATKDYSKDIDNDLFGDIEANNAGGIQHLYHLSKKTSLFYTKDSVFMSTLSSARLIDEKTIKVFFNPNRKDFEAYKKRFNVLIDGESYQDFSIENINKKVMGNTISFQLDIKLKKAIHLSEKVTIKYRFASDFIDERNVMLNSYYDSESFQNNFNYSGDDLGVTFGGNVDLPNSTTFKVWSPVSKKMVLNIYNSGDYEKDLTAETYDMILGEKGVWSYTFNENLHGKYYTYTVTNSAGENEVVDPYAKSCGMNGRRGMVVNFHQLNKTIEGWEEDTRPYYGDNATDASIYEIHVRDMTINPNSGVSSSNRGRFLGLTEKGTTFTKGTTTVSTGLDHLEELGITHVQIQPMYDYASIDEKTLDTSMGEDNYNWGYDPLNYNCLEGSYSCDPSNGFTRIKEAKQMIMALHKAGINITMDVVYNHTSSLGGSNFAKIMPDYYHRTKASGTAYNGSGCGNEMASERFMVNKFMRESCEFWIDEYHMSGFRFDLMGLIDNQTMIDIYQETTALYDKALVYGEPWCGGTSKLVSGTDPNKLTSQQTVQSSLAAPYFAGEGIKVGAFNDGIRNGIRGDNAPGMGWVTGLPMNVSTIKSGVMGMFNSNQNTIEPEQVLNYTSCHDNYTLYDQLVQRLSKSTNLDYAYTQADTVVFTSQGIPFIQEGEDFMRTKAFEDTDEKGQTITRYSGNSYNVGDLINNMDYELKADKVQIYNFFKSLIKFRKITPQLRLSSRLEINNAMDADSVTTDNNGLLTYRYKTNQGEIYVINTIYPINISFGGNYKLLFSNYDSFNVGSTYSSLMLQNNCSVVLLKQ